MLLLVGLLLLLHLTLLHLLLVHLLRLRLLLREDRRRRGRLDEVLRCLLAGERRGRRGTDGDTGRRRVSAGFRVRRVNQRRRVRVVVAEPLNQPVLAQLHRFLLVLHHDRRERVHSVDALLFSGRVPAASVQAYKRNEKE
jgi:hypothetical protein